MKRFIPILSIIFIFSMGCASQKGTWKSPTYTPENYRNVLVLAKTSDQLAQRQLEDATVQQLKSKGISAIPAYSNITATDIESEENFRDKADKLQVDALLVYTFGNIESEYKQNPSINAHLGLPINLGIFRGYLGTNVPLAGGSRKVETVKGQAGLYTRERTIQWSQSLKGNLKYGSEEIANEFATRTVRSMIGDDLFLKKK